MLRLVFAAAFTLSFSLVLGQSRAEASQCFAYAGQAGGLHRAGLTTAQQVEGVEITYVTHSTFRIKTPEGVVVATDYTGYAGKGPLPDIVTMNHAHETHYTDFPDPQIKHVLRGWNPSGGAAEHFLEVADLIVRNIPTDIRRWGGTFEPFGNSIFIFEVADLCIGHLGHLHHKPTPEQLALIGRLDVVFAPVDGTYTLDLGTMIEVLKDLRASLVIPMHFFGEGSLNIFIAGMRDAFAIEFEGDAKTLVSLQTLPARPTVLVLSGL